MVAAGAAFGNSFTLPAVFLTTLLPAPLASRALGYAALFLLAWSPCLWSIGMALIGGTPAQQRQQQRAASRAAAAAQELQQLQEQQPSGQQEGVQTAGSSSGPKPLTWRQPRAVDVTPLSSSGGSLGSGDGAGAGEVPTWAEQLAQHPAVAWLSQFAAQVGLGGMRGAAERERCNRWPPGCRAAARLLPPMRCVCRRCCCCVGAELRLTPCAPPPPPPPVP